MLYSSRAVPSSLSGLPPGLDGTRATLRKMVTLARQYKRDPGIVILARQLTDHVARGNEKNYQGELYALQRFVRDQIRYVRDVHGVELLQTPPHTLQIRAGDCDDKSVLLAALLGSMGFPTRFAAVGFKGNPPSHVLVEAKLGTVWIPCETIVTGKNPGWYPEGTTGRLVLNV